MSFISILVNFLILILVYFSKNLGAQVKCSNQNLSDQLKKNTELQKNTCEFKKAV